MIVTKCWNKFAGGLYSEVTVKFYQMSLCLLFVKYTKTGFSEEMFSDIHSTPRALFRNVMLNWRQASLLCRTLYCTREN